MDGLVTIAVEGDLDEAVLRAIVRSVGLSVQAVYGKQGKDQLRARLRAWNRAARHAPWIVLMDLDRDAGCAPPFVSSLLSHPEPMLRLRIAVRAVEAWLLADAERMAGLLGVPRAQVAGDPDALDDPKRALLDLASRSRRGDVRARLLPRPGSTARVGPAYSSCLSAFALDPARGWRPEIAARRSDSLRRCLRAARSLVGPVR